MTRLNDSIVALTPVIMKCLERILLRHIKYRLPVGLDRNQFANKGNWSTEDAVSVALHTALTHLQHPDTYVMMLFVDSAQHGELVEGVDNVRFLGIQITCDLTWSLKAQQRLFFLRKLKRAGLFSQLLVNFYRAVTDVSGNDTWLRQSEVTKVNVASVCNFAKTMLDSEVFSGPPPNLTSDDMFSRSFNRWLFRWCPANNVGYVNNCFMLKLKASSV